MERQTYPSDVSDDEWSFVAPYLTLMTEEAPQREHDLREVFNGLRWIVRTGAQWRMMPHDLPPWAAVYQMNRTARRRGKLAQAVQDVTGHTVQVAFVDQGYTGDAAVQAATDQGIQLHVIKLAQAKHGFVLLPRRWVVERSFAWMTRFRRLARDYERLPETLAGLHLLAFTVLLLHRFTLLMAHCPSSS